jgi:hypothetical protein
MMAAIMVWPSFFPAGCPYADSSPAEGEVYRLLAGLQPNPNDFKSYRELFPKRKFQVPECEACGLSVYRALNDLSTLIKRVPKMRARRVARGVLRADFGFVAPTPKRNEHSHCTWWVPVGIDPWTVFEVVELRNGGARP